MAVPDPFVGCWVRDGVSVGDEAMAEPADVMWLQGREWFADVRAARPGIEAGSATMALGARAEAFGGRCTWTALPGVAPASAGRLDWAHEIDFSGGFAEGDGAEVRWVSDGWFEEHGDLGDGDPPTGFREVWRATGGSGPLLAAVGLSDEDGGGEACGTGLVVAVGCERLLLLDRRTEGSFVWSHSRRDDRGVWRVLRRHDPAAGDLEGAAVPPGLLAAEQTSDWLCTLDDVPEPGTSFAGEGIEWVVMESHGRVHDDVRWSKQYRNTASVRSPA